MVIKAQVADTVTGDRVQTLPTSNVRWEKRILSPDSITVDMTLAPRAHQRLDIRNSTMEVKSSLIVSDDDYVIGAGPIWERSYDDGFRKWAGVAEGGKTLLDHRFILPGNVTPTNIVIQSGDDEGEPNPAVATKYVGRSWPYIVRSLIEQSLAKDGGALPMVFGSDGTGAHDITYEAASFKTIGEALDDLSKRDQGPEIAFVPRIVNNRLQWLVRVGDDTKLDLSSQTVHMFDFTAPKRRLRGESAFVRA